MRRYRLLLGLVSLAVCLALLPSVAAAQTGATVVATGLANPRGIAVGPDGTIFVAESGTGGLDQFTAPPPFGSGTRGTTAQIVRIAPDGTKRGLVVGLPSIVLGGEVIGVKGLILSGNNLYYTTGYAFADTPAIYGPFVGRVDLAAATAVNLADIGAYEKANNPDGFTVETDAYGIAQAPDGTLWVADAGGNTIYKVDTAGRLSLVGVVPGLPGQMPNPGRKGASEMDPVPTGIAVGRDGTVYVALLTGFPFPTGGAKVVKINANGTFSDVATGLNPMVDAKIGPDGMLYMVEFASGFSLTSQPPSFIPSSGRVLRIGPAGAVQVMVSGLNFPGGVSFDAAGRMYVTENTDNPPQAGALGRILRFDQLTPSALPPPQAPAAPPAPAVPVATPVPAAPPPSAPAPVATPRQAAAQLPGSAQQLPTALPRTGGLPLAVPLAVGGIALLGGWTIGRRRANWS